MVRSTSQNHHAVSMGHSVGGTRFRKVLTHSRFKISKGKTHPESWRGRSLIKPEFLFSPTRPNRRKKKGRKEEEREKGILSWKPHSLRLFLELHIVTGIIHSVAFNRPPGCVWRFTEACYLAIWCFPTLLFFFVVSHPLVFTWLSLQQSNLWLPVTWKLPSKREDKVARHL